MTTGAGASARRKGPRFRTSAIVLVVGIVIAIPAVVVIGLSFWGSLTGPTYSIPGTVRADLGSGTHLVFERTGSRDSYGPLTIRHDRGVTLDATQVIVTAPDGTNIEVRNSTPNDTIDRNSEHYASALKFDAPEAGTYELRFATGAPGTVIIQRPLGDTLSRHAPWVATIAVGWVIALVGISMLLVGVVRRGRADRKALNVIESQQLPGAAWFPDPQQVHRLRYWDGREWTDHFAD